MLDLPISRRVVQLYRSCLTSRIHPFDFININKHSGLINSNLCQRSKISVVENNKVRSEEDSTSKQAHVQFVNKQPSDFWFHQVLRCFRVVSSQFWTSSKWLLALEIITNNQEVKRSLCRLQNVNNLPKDYIRMCVTGSFYYMPISCSFVSWNSLGVYSVSPETQQKIRRVEI